MRSAQRDRRRGWDVEVQEAYRPENPSGEMAAETNRAVSTTSGWTLGRAKKSHSAIISADLRPLCRTGKIADGIEAGHVARAERSLSCKWRVDGLSGDR